MLELMNMAPGKTQHMLPINFVDEFNISMETTGGYASWINESNKKHNRTINNMVRSGLIDSNQHEKKW